MRNVKKSWLVILFGALFALGGITQNVKAASSNGDMQQIPLSVIPVQNKYQVNANTGFYDLEMQPGQKTQLQMKLANTGAKTIVVKMQAIAATTNTGSQLVYSEAGKKPDSTLKYPLSSLIQIPKTYEKLKIPANTTALFHMPLTMPATKFKGIILGAIRVSPVTEAATKAGLRNTYGYSGAVRLSNGLSERPDLRLKDVTVTHDFAGTNVDTTLQNFKPSMLRNGTLETKVTKRGQNRKLKALTINKASAAPNSTWTVSTPWDGAVAPGDYTMHVTYISTDPQFSGTKVWKFSRNFHISTVDAARYNLTNLNIPWWVYAILAVILLLLIILIILLVKRRKGDKRRVEE